MKIDLYQHNQIAYDAAVSMLAETRKAAVVHPTGTGKSFIGFKLAEDNPNSVICWLSPSEYIFKTQLENIAAAGAEVPQNIAFFTYAKLMLMDDEGIMNIKPDFIIFDEFHRCGAEQWGMGVEKLLKAFPDAPVLGLSATNIRYLDNQRDMADELFDGNIASEMTLGEAIVRGILNPPTYVISVYSYQKDLDKFKARIRRAKNKAARDKAEGYFEALRHALDKADGLDEIFHKHIREKDGKYIVFCANLEHMNEMVQCIPEWFFKVDKQPHVYKAYSEDPATSKAFADFKADKSDHLKLLFCIDMLNEGIHVDDVSGVVLFRPTVSPIIYKQQIGRALCAGKMKEPIIFDIVNNFENLYSIGTIEQEMQAAITYYRFLGEDNAIITERFKIIDEVRDCRELFDAMNDALTASWDLMYVYAKQYYEEHCNLEIPFKYKTAEGYSLGAWLHTQRKVRAGEIFGKLDEERIAKLDALGMIWGSYLDIAWENHFAEAKQYFDEHGDLNVNINYRTATGFALGKWMSSLRVSHKNDIRQGQLTAARIKRLDDIGMIWDVPDYLWEQNYLEAMTYYRENGHLDVPHHYTSPNGIKLGIWIRNLRSIRLGNSKGAPLTEEQIARLNSIGMLWEDKFTRSWNKGFSEAQKYFEVHGNLDVPAMYVLPSGFKLGDWISNQREALNRMSAERHEKLDSIGMIWEKPDSWEVRYALAKIYFEEHGDLNIPNRYKANGIWLEKWLNEQRQIYLGKRPGKVLTQDQIKRLEAISFDWKCSSERTWEERYIGAKTYFETHGNLSVPNNYIDANGKQLAPWIVAQRKYYQQGKLSSEQTQKLTDIGMDWNFRNKKLRRQQKDQANNIKKE